VALPVGATIAGFRVLRLLGEGGMGAVYLVQHPDLPRQDVLKVMHGGLAQQPALRARFEHEAQLAAALNHPNIVQVFDRGIDGDALWIRMQYVEGTDAARALVDGPLDPERVLHIVRSVGSALDYAHRAGLLHRDVKPANILLAPGEHADDPEHVLLTDFGIAKAMDVEVRLTGTGQPFLTPGYSAPERFGTEEVDRRVDVYSLGCVLFELLTGRLPFPYESFLALLRAHDQEPVPDIHELRPDVPAGVSDVIRTALAKDRDERYPTCRALVEAYAAALHAPRPAEPAPARGPEPDPAPPTERGHVGHPAGPHRVTVLVSHDGGRSMTVAGVTDTARLGGDDRRRVETLVQEACAARERMPAAEPVPPGSALAELAIEHTGGTERIRFVVGGSHHPPEWDRLAERASGPEGVYRLRATGRPTPTAALEPAGGVAPPKPRRPRRLWVVLALLLALGTGGVITYSWISTQYYVGSTADGGPGSQVAIFQGVDGFLGLFAVHLSVEETGIPLDSLPPIDRARVRDGIDADDRADARRIVDIIGNRE
jgi:hypothetical protein